MTDEIRAIGDWRTNGEMIADVAALGYIEGKVLDLTYGEGAFWTEWCPDVLIENDLHKGAEWMHHEDFRATSFASGAYDTVVFDPPYKMGGTPSSEKMDKAYGTEEYRSRIEILSLLVGGIAEAARLSNKWVLVKCQDQVSSGEVRWQTQTAVDTARALGMRLFDSFMLPGGRPQPAGTQQKHARRNYSSLLVFRHGRA
jgi:hypothetical protein